MSVAGPAAPSGTRTEEAWAEDGRDWRADPRNDGPPDLLTGFRFPEGHVLGPLDAGKPISRQEFWELEFEGGWRYERGGGRLEVMPPPRRPHRRAAFVFRFHLSRYWMENQARVADVEGERWAHTDAGGDRQTDTTVVLKNSPLRGTAACFTDPERAPDVAIEFVSPGTDARRRDYGAKRAEYHAIGVREYVIVDPRDRRVTVLRWEPGGYAEAAVLGPTDAYTSPLLPGLSIPLAEAIGDAAGADGE